MKLFACLDIAYACGLETVSEAYANINYHSINTFAYDEIHDELTELAEDFYKYGLVAKGSDEEAMYHFINPDLSIHAALDKMNEMDGTNLVFTEYQDYEEDEDEGI